MSFQIRFFQDSDYDEIFELKKEKLNKNNTQYSEEELIDFLLSYLSHTSFTGSVDSERFRNCLIVEEDNEIKAFISFDIIGDNQEANFIYLESFSNKRAYGIILLEKLISIVENFKYSKIKIIKLTAESIAHVRLYKKLGFKELYPNKRDYFNIEMVLYL